MFLLETETKIIENTLRWISWAIDSTRRGTTTHLFTAGVKESSILSTAIIAFGFSLDSGMKTPFDMLKKIFREVWKEADTDNKTNLARDFLEFELINTRINLAEENIKELREVQKILFSPRDKKLEEAVKYIDEMHNENDNSFEKRLATVKIEAKKTDHAIEISHKNAIDSAFRILTLKLHPDKGGDTERFKILQDIRGHLLHVDLEHESIVEISKWNRALSAFQVYVEEDFQVLRILLQGKSIPKNWEWSEKSIKKMADDGVDTSPFL